MEKLKVLFVDDDIDFGKLMHIGLTALRHDVHFQTSLSGIEGVIAQYSPSIIVLDVEIGNENGIEKARQIVRQFPSIPILFVSSHTDISFIAQGLDVGAVNYLKKPFDIQELDVYIKRFAKQQRQEKSIYLGNYWLNTETAELYYNNHLLKQLSPLGKNALQLLWENKNTAVSNDMLSRVLWGKEYASNLDASIHNLISKLRKILNKDKKLWITTVKRVGYQLTVL
ncbi:MAG: response regulator transcription factor [Bacteroidia bacterium]|nr:response regulator transcription factor [Bacteroidia bacterium]